MIHPFRPVGVELIVLRVLHLLQGTDTARPLWWVRLARLRTRLRKWTVDTEGSGMVHRLFSLRLRLLTLFRHLGVVRARKRLGRQER